MPLSALASADERADPPIGDSALGSPQHAAVQEPKAQCERYEYEALPDEALRKQEEGEEGRWNRCGDP